VTQWQYHCMYRHFMAAALGVHWGGFGVHWGACGVQRHNLPVELSWYQHKLRHCTSNLIPKTLAVWHSHGLSSWELHLKAAAMAALDIILTRMS